MIDKVKIFKKLDEIGLELDMLNVRAEKLNDYQLLSPEGLSLVRNMSEILGKIESLNWVLTLID